MATRRRTSTGTRRRTTSTRRRTTRGRYPTRRRRKGTAASFGSAFGLVLVWVLVSAPWWVKILAVVLALAAGVGYVLLTRGTDDEPDQTDTSAPPSEGTPA